MAFITNEFTPITTLVSVEEHGTAGVAEAGAALPVAGVAGQPDVVAVGERAHEQWTTLVVPTRRSRTEEATGLTLWTP